ncbi:MULTISPECIES: hypothetical protein [Sinorhizobium]|uniref:hypothetical protein n=1 Tax=Sinorhizobium TaxID=28105 RepID=UPI000FD8D80F|nr:MULTISPECIES: hypothetical protein [Sinorhizobium]RVO60614.1 hypothetical protein CN092_04605 [Sinorhizobium meliloti]
MREVANIPAETITAPPVVILAWHAVPDPQGSLRGYVDLQIPRWRLRLMSCAAFSNGENEWIALPSRPTGKDGKWVPLVAFDDQQTAQAFGRAAIAALDGYAPRWRG